jgi:hypothetical protein
LGGSKAEHFGLFVQEAEIRPQQAESFRLAVVGIFLDDDFLSFFIFLELQYLA